MCTLNKLAVTLVLDLLGIFVFKIKKIVIILYGESGTEELVENLRIGYIIERETIGKVWEEGVGLSRVKLGQSV